jgi:hypothetical protein
METWQKMTTTMGRVTQMTNLNSESAPTAAMMAEKNCGTARLLMTRINDKKEEITLNSPLPTLSNVE